MSMSTNTAMNGGDTEPFLEDGNRPHVLLPPEVEETEKHVPTCASSWAKFKSWFWKFQYPLKVIFLNFISWVLVQSLLMNSGGIGYYPRHFHGSDNFQFKTMLCAAFTISLLTFGVDANLCLTAARSMEQTVQKWRQEGEAENSAGTNTTDTSTNTTTEEPKEKEEKEDPYIYVKLSRKVDSAFGCPSGSMTFLVAFLYSLFAITAWQATLSGAGLLQVQLTPTEDLGEKGSCFLGSASSFFEDYSMYESGEEWDGISSLRSAPGFDALPAEVQKWIQGHSNRDSGGMIYLGRRGLANIKKFNQSRPYLQLSDGSWVFAKANSAGNPFYHRSSTLTRDRKPGFAVISPETNTVKEYSTAAAEEAGDDELFDGMRYVEGIELVGFPAQPPYSAWCGIFKLHKRGLFQDEVLCYNVNNSVKKLQRFLPVMQDGKRWCYWSGDQYSLFAIPDDYTLWMATKRTWSKCNHNGNREKRNMALTLLAYNTETMEKTVPLMLNTTKDRQYGGGGERTLRPVCRGTYWISFGASVLSLGLLSAFLYRSEGVPSCTVPAALAVSHLISVLFKPAAAGVAILAGAGACLFLLLAVRRASNVWKYVSTEMLVWALYTLQLASNAVFWWPSFSDYTFYDHEVLFSFLLPFPLLSFLMAAVTTVLLDHPVFQLMAVCFGCLSLFTVLMVVAGLNFLMVPVGLCALALGCFRAGTLLQTFRVHVLVYARRLYLQCCAKSRWLQRRTTHGS